MGLNRGGLFLGAAAVFHVLAASHLPMILGVLDAKTFAFLNPIIPFTFQLCRLGISDGAELAPGEVVKRLRESRVKPSC